jgi:putative membrane-bound dehydrogenase-like protein
MRHAIVLALLAALGFARATSSQLIGNLAAELPRILPTEPSDAAKSFTLAPGFRIELVASEPLIRSPVAIDFDEDGRLFVAEFPEYNLHDDAAFKERGSIKRLEDADGDGIYDKAATFADNIPAAAAVACWKGGAFVGTVPHLLECRDTDGDGKSDRRDIVFTGFERDKAGEGMLNSIRWSLDNRFHLSTSSAGGAIRAGDDIKKEQVNVRGRFVIFDPRTRTFEAVSAHGQHGMSMDDWGRAFVCDNSNPIHHVVYDGRYAARNPFAIAPPVAINIHVNAGEPNLVRTSPFEPWRVTRTKLRMAGLVKGPTEGGRVGGHFTGATGVTIYRGDAFPAECRGQAFVGDVSNNIVHRMTLSPKGVSFVARRADEGREFLASKDNWFRPCQFANGPDGCLYVVDMYRELIETVESIPPEIRKHLHPRSGFDRGRIWRIVHEGSVRRPMPKLSKATTKELVALLDHANGWHRDTASRLLYERQDRSAIPLLVDLTRNAKTPQGRVHALASLSGLESLSESAVLQAMNDADARVREFAVKLGERFADRPAVVAAWAKTALDDDVRVRWQAALSLGATRDSSAVDGLARIAAKDGADVWFRFAIVSSSHGRAAELVRRLHQDRQTRHLSQTREIAHQLVVAVAQSKRDDEISELLKTIESLTVDDASIGFDLSAALLARLPAATRTRLKSATLDAALASVLADARRVAIDAKQSPETRAAAVRKLRLGDFADVRPLCERLLHPKEPEAIQRAAIEALASFNNVDTANVMLDAWPGLSPAVRAAAAESLFSRAASTARLLDRMEKGQIRSNEIDPARIALLRMSADAALRSRIDKLFTAPSKRADVIASYKPALDKLGDIDRGRTLFRKHCTACHRRESVGEQLGADLAGIGQRGAEFLLVNILDPNREVLPKFVAYQAETSDGRVIAGMIQTETATSLTLRRLDGTSETILRTNLESLRGTGLSFMPEGFESQLTPRQMADLIAYLLATS